MTLQNSTEKIVSSCSSDLTQTSKKNRKKQLTTTLQQQQQNRNSASNSSIHSNPKSTNSSINGGGLKKAATTNTNPHLETTLLEVNISPSSKIPHKDKSATYFTDVLLSLNYENLSSCSSESTATKKSNKKNGKKTCQC